MEWKNIDQELPVIDHKIKLLAWNGKETKLACYKNKKEPSFYSLLNYRKLANISYWGYIPQKGK